jgi:signal transduction histidine kinase
METRFPKTLQTTLIGVISLSVFLVMLIATLLHLSFVSRSLNNKLKDEALTLARTFDVLFQGKQELEDTERLRQKILALKASRPYIAEIDIVTFAPTEPGQLYVAATTRSPQGGEDSGPLGVHVIITHTPMIILETADRKTGRDIHHFSKEQVGILEMIKSLFHKDQIYLWEILAPLDNQNQVIGSVGIEISLDEVIGQIQASLSEALLVLSGSLAGIILIVWYCLRRIILRPLQVLSEGIQTVRAGNFSHKLEVKRQDELGRLATAYNDMLESLQHYRAEITELNGSLQDRVDKATTELQEINRALTSKIVELKETQQKLICSERDAAAALIAASIAHEIKNPLSAIKLAFQHIQDKFMDSQTRNNLKYQELYKLCLDQIQQLDGLVMAFLDYTRPIKLHLVSCSLHEVVENALGLVINEGTPWGKIAVQREYAEDLPLITMDRELFKRAFVNLILNAIQAMPNGGVLTIRTELISQTRQVQMIITDTGVGIEEAYLEKLFDPFFTTKTNGIGLGLAVVQRAIKVHDGQISVTSQVGKGTSFCIELAISGESRSK